MTLPITSEGPEFGNIKELRPEFSSVVTRPDLEVTAEEEEAFRLIPAQTIDAPSCKA